MLAEIWLNGRSSDSSHRWLGLPEFCRKAPRPQPLFSVAISSYLARESETYSCGDSSGISPDSLLALLLQLCATGETVKRGEDRRALGEISGLICHYLSPLIKESYGARGT